MLNQYKITPHRQEFQKLKILEALYIKSKITHY